MAEAGGPATQSGIFFQNTIASRYLGRLCDPSDRPAAQIVLAVRVEAPGSVDDIVVTFGDRHRNWINAKERLDPGSTEFAAVWQGFDRQFAAPEFTEGDRLVLVVGTPHNVHEAVSDLAERACASSSLEEWRAGLAKKHEAALERLRRAISSTNDEHLWKLLSHVDVESTSLRALEEQSWAWMPTTSVAKQTLFRLLRDRVGRHARVRREFVRQALVRDLHEQDNVDIVALESAETVYSEALSRHYCRIAIPGTSISGLATAIYEEPLLRMTTAISENTNLNAFYEQEVYEREGERIGLEAFDAETPFVIVAPAGFGKTELVRTLARRFLGAGLVPAVVPLVDADARAVPLIAYLEQVVNGALASDVDWRMTAEQGRVVLLLDGLDELSEHPRAQAIKRLNEFTARFPKSRWILTVRDQSALMGTPEATTLALEPWHDERRLALASKFFGSNGDTRAEALCTRLGYSPELDRLARVPLFLALIVEESKNDGFDLGSLRRADLLFRYVDRLISTELDADKRPTTNARRVLIDAAETIALAALQAGAQELPEELALDALPDTPNASPEVLLSDLVASGLLRVSRRRVRFVFPLVQEFLAGRKLQRSMPITKIVERFRAATTQPWGQALRFALEQSENADAIAQALLGEADDAFNSVALALGQCVADGAQVGVATRSVLGERLGKLWAESAFSQHDALTRVLAGGFSSPLPLSARSALEGSRRVDQGGGTLLSAACDDTLSRSVLKRTPLPFGSSSVMQNSRCHESRTR